MLKFAKKEIDMLHGPLAGKLIRFAVPLALTNILQQLFNSADLAVIGRFEDATAMAAVGSNAPVINLLVSLFGGLSLGTNVVIAMLIGMNRKDDIGKAVHTSLLLAMISGAIVCALGECFAPQLLVMMNTPKEVLKLATLYLRIFFVALPFFMIYDFGASILRARGDSTRPLIILTISGLLNVGLNIFFVAGLHWSVAGVAVATLISNIVSTSLVIGILMREKGEFHFSFRKMRLDKFYTKRIIKIGGPAGLQGMVFSLSNVFIQTGINQFGADCIAGNTAAQNLEFMSYFVVFAFAQAATTFTSQNYAASRPDRCRKIYLLSFVLGSVASLGLSLVFFFGRNVFLGIFTTDAGAVYYGSVRLMFVGLLECFTGLFEVAGGCMRGMGHSLLPAVLTVLCCVVFRMAWLYTVFQHFNTLTSLLWTYPISWLLCGGLVTIAYLLTRKKEFAKFA